MDAATMARPVEGPGAAHDRPRAALELVTVVGLLEWELWSLRAHGPGWLNVLVYGAIVAAIGHSAWRRRDLAPDRFPIVGAGRAWSEAAAACLALSAVLMIAAALVGDASETFEFVFLDKPPARLLIWLLGKFGAALGQQLALQLFLWPACAELTRGRAAGILMAAAIFGLIHLPSPTLVAITTLAGVAWISLYRRGGRLAPLVASHMVLATLAHGGLPERLTYDMRVGLTATADMRRFEELNDPRIRLINRRLKDNRASLRRFTSEEYYSAQGGDLPGFVRGLFRDILGRTPTDADVAFWAGRGLDSPRDKIPQFFLASDEYARIRDRRIAEARGPTLRR